MYAHQFALYTTAPLPEQAPATLVLIDQPLCHRITHVLRLEQNETFVLFNDTTVCTVKLMQAAPRKGTLQVTVLTSSPSVPLQPAVTVYVGLAKKEALEEVAYACAQLGASNIVPFICKRVQRRWGGDRERERLTSIMVGGCEQAKQFVLPTLHEPIAFSDMVQRLANTAGPHIYFTPTGQPLMQVMQTITQPTPVHLSLIIGPEGGLETSEETALLPSTVACKLCPTILRTRDMGILGLGMVRSLF